MLKTESRTYRLIGLTPILGSQPAERDLREKYILSKAPTEALREEEAAIDSYERDERGVTVFNRNRKDQLCVMARHISGYFKEAMSSSKVQHGVGNVKSKIDTLLFPEPWFIPLTRDGEPLREEDEMLERPLRRDQGLSGPRTTLCSSELVNDPWELEFELTLMPNAATKASKSLSWDAIELALDYGAYRGLGQWRNAGYGKFIWRRVDEDDET